MKLKTRWKRVYNPIIGIRFFDGGDYSLGYFKIIKLWSCLEYCGCAETADGSHWFPKTRMLVKTDTGLAYKMPFFPWMKAYDSAGQKSIADYYNINSYMLNHRVFHRN